MKNISQEEIKHIFETASDIYLPEDKRLELLTLHLETIWSKGYIEGMNHAYEQWQKIVKGEEKEYSYQDLGPGV